MGLTKQYLAYKPVGSFNLITSGRSNVNFASYKQIEGRYAASAAAEDVIVWDMRLGERVMTLRRNKEEVTALRMSPDRLHIAIGYADGVVNIFHLSTTHPICSLKLHKSAITIIRYDKMGLRIVCGSLDTEIIAVDVVEQTGRHRLIGHNAPITDAHYIEGFGTEQNIVVSSSRDTQIKFWNLETQFCFKTIVDNRTEVWALAFAGSLIFAGSSESAINVYSITQRFDKEGKTTENVIDGLSIDDDGIIPPISVQNCGAIQRAGKGRVVNLLTDLTEKILTCHGTDDLIECFYILSEDEARQRLTKRLSREGNASIFNEQSLGDKIRRLQHIRMKQKIKSIDIVMGVKHELRIVTSLSNNCLELHSLNIQYEKSSTVPITGGATNCLSTLSRLGHQSEVRVVCFSSDSLAIGSGAAESFKFWNRESMQCLRTLSTEYILSAVFAPGDRFILLGTKSGELLVVDVGTAEISERIAAHTGEVWSIALLSDQTACVSGSGDMTVKLWTYELVYRAVKEENVQQSGKVLSLLHKNTLKFEEAVLCVRVSADLKYLAVGLLDSTAKVFFLDSFKFYLSLYGHKLPVLCADISYDSALIATGSADRNIKIWGLDFGDCRRSLFAHDDSVMDLKFIDNTHMFFTCGKDGRINQWDGDTFEKVITLPGHIGEAYSLSVSPNGRFLVTCGSDRTLRLFERTDELIVLQDKQEEEREEFENRQLATDVETSVMMLPRLILGSRKTIDSEKAAESILELLEMRKREEFEEAEHKSNLQGLMSAYDVDNYDSLLLTILTRIKTSDLEEALLLLPFTNVCELLEILLKIIAQGNDEIEVLCKIIIFLFKVHMKPTMSSIALKSLLEKIVRILRKDIHNLRNVIGYNLYGLALWNQHLKSCLNYELFYEAKQTRKTIEKHKREVTKRLQISSF